MTDNFTGDFFKLIGKPMQWNSDVYGVTAVHVIGISPNGRVAKISIDGGEASKQAQRFPELSDGEGFAILGELARRPATRTRRSALPVLPTAEQVRNVSAKEAVAMVKPARKPRKAIKNEVTF